MKKVSKNNVIISEQHVKKGEKYNKHVDKVQKKFHEDSERIKKNKD